MFDQCCDPTNFILFLVQGDVARYLKVNHLYSGAGRDRGKRNMFGTPLIRRCITGTRSAAVLKATVGALILFGNDVKQLGRL